jgi:4-amino-4-deoxy-L-arabinose transferase-like glycosyltransferase
VFTVVEPPELPVRPRSRGLLKFGLLSLLLGLALGVALAVAKDLMADSRTGKREELLELAALREAALDDLTHPWRPLRRLVRRTPAGR